MTAPKEILFEEEARLKLSRGIGKLADVVGVTLGPRGRNIGLEKGWSAPQITSDGGSVAQDISLQDTWENMGALMAKEVIQKVKETCGDGTTTATLILKALVDHGVKQISNGSSPIHLKRGIDKAVEFILKELDQMALPIKNSQEIQNVATVSASGNEEIGKLIAQAMEKVGKDGVITIESSKGTENTLDWVEGMQFDRGWLSPYFCTDNDKMQVVMDHPSLLIVDKKIASVQEILPILQTIASKGKPLLIIAEDFEGDVLSTLVLNRLRGSLKVAAIKAPGFGDRRKALLKDIAILTGADVISEEAGMTLQEAGENHLGSAGQVIVQKDKTTIVEGGGRKRCYQSTYP